MRTWLLIAIAVAACSKGDKGGPSSRDGVIVAWKKGNLDPAKFSDVKTNVGKDCGQTTVNKIDVLVCVFPSAKDAKAAEDSGLEWVGDTTGVSKAQGELLIVAADRKKVDPTGKVIAQIIGLPAK